MPEEIIQLQNEYYIHSTSARIDDRTRVLKHGDSFAVFDRFGDIEPFGRTQFGLFHLDTRFLSRLTVRLCKERLLLLSSAIKADNAILTVDLMNPDVERAGEVVISHGTLHVFRSQALWDGTCHDRLRIHNYGHSAVSFSLGVTYEADFADIFEVRGTERARRGCKLPAEIGTDRLVLAYEGLDGKLRRTHIIFDPPPSSLGETEAEYELRLAPQAATTLRWSTFCEVVGGSNESAGDGRNAIARTLLPYEEVAEKATAALSAARTAEPELWTSNEQFNEWVNRSLSDLHMLRTDTHHGPYPYAGVPWFSTVFGRDGIITALSCLWLAPDVARGVLSYLAATQADEDNPGQDAQPGKVLHETRRGEMAATGEVPFARYYGSVDATPLFIVLTGAYQERTGDLAFVRSIWPHIERALGWIDRYGDVDGDGFVEYARRSPRGLVHQGWKDSHDSVFHEDGALAEGPIALCEVQSYVYGAKNAAARLAVLLGLTERARELERQAEQLRQRFEEVFWCEEISTYALALDGKKRPCRVKASNAGHCLFTGFASKERARRVAATLMAEPGFSGWGVRTVASTEARFNPMSYHNGSVWPHDNAVISAGFGRYGMREQAAKILSGLLDASRFFDLHRLPELFCGFARRPGENPTLYPTACSPQAWAAASPLLCLQACLGMEVNGTEERVCFRHPFLPQFIGQINIKGLRVGNSSVDLAVTRFEHDVGVRLIRKVGDVEFVVLM